MAPGLLDLPTDLLILIVDFIPLRTRARFLSRVCKRFRALFIPSIRTLAASNSLTRIARSCPALFAQGTNLRELCISESADPVEMDCNLLAPLATRVQTLRLKGLLCGPLAQVLASFACLSSLEIEADASISNLASELIQLNRLRLTHLAFLHYSFAFLDQSVRLPSLPALRSFTMHSGHS